MKKIKLNRKNIILYIGAVLTIFLFVIAVLAPYITPYDPTKMEISQKFIKPCAEHLLGTDHLGRDIFSRIILGSRISLATSVTAVFISAFIGTFLGVISGYLGGVIDTIIMRIVDVMLAFPAIVFALALSAVLGKG